MIQVVTAISSVRVHCLSSKPKSCFAQFILFLTAGGGAECRLNDTALYLAELCEVGVDNAVIAQAFNESRGRYRLLTSACRTLEVVAKQDQKTRLTAADIKGVVLCEDAMRSLRKGK